MAGSDLLTRITWLHHFTDTRNLKLIRELGGLYSRRQLQKMGLTGFYPGGNQWSLDADDMAGMADYVHLCMRPSHPMEYLAKQDGRIERTLWLYIDAKSVFDRDGVDLPPSSHPFITRDSRF